MARNRIKERLPSRFELQRAVLSREFWRRIGCLKPDGGLKGMMARVAMLRFSTDACPSTGPIATAPPSGQGIALHVIR